YGGDLDVGADRIEITEHPVVDATLEPVVGLDRRLRVVLLSGRQQTRGRLDRRRQRAASEGARCHEHVRIALDALELDAASVDVDLGVADAEPERTRDSRA